MFIRSLYSATLLAVVLIVTNRFSQGIPILEYLIRATSSAATALPRSLFYIGISMVGLFLFVNSMRFQAAGVSGLIICVSSSISATAGWLLNDEPFSLTLPISLAVSCIGVLLLERIDLLKQPDRKGMALALSAAICWGYANIGFKEMIPQTGILQFSLLQEITVLATSGFLLLIAGIKRNNATNQKTPSRLSGSEKLLVLLIGVCSVAGVLFCNLGMRQLPLSIFSILVLSQPLSTFILASVWLKEKTTWQQKTGAVLILVGMMLAT